MKLVKFSKKTHHMNDRRVTDPLDYFTLYLFHFSLFQLLVIFILVSQCMPFSLWVVKFCDKHFYTFFGLLHNYTYMHVATLNC